MEEIVAMVKIKVDRNADSWLAVEAICPHCQKIYGKVHIYKNGEEKKVDRFAKYKPEDLEISAEKIKKLPVVNCRREGCVEKMIEVVEAMKDCRLDVKSVCPQCKCIICDVFIFDVEHGRKIQDSSRYKPANLAISQDQISELPQIKCDSPYCVASKVA